MEIRQATRDDVPNIVRLLADDELGAAREDTSEPLASSYLDAFAAIDRDPELLLVVAEEEGRIVGTMQLMFLPHLTFRGGWRAQIEAVRVDRSHRGGGLGKELMLWAIETSRDRGCHAVQLTTNLHRPEAHRFYEALGFEASHTGMKLYLDGDVRGRERS